MEESTQLHSVLKFYVDELRQHQEYVKAHLEGTSCDEPPLLPAFLPPSSYWTSAEKALFFHALSVYSRLQPELIAQHVKTKSTFDVCVYLQVLQRAAELMEEEANETDDAMRAEIEPAMEVSEKWVLREETIAESLMSLDACPCSLEGSSPKLIEKCNCPSTSEGASQELVDHLIFQNNYINHLDPTCLTVLEMIRKEGETETCPDDAQEERHRSSSVLDPRESLPPGEDADQQMSIASSKNPSPKPDKAQLRRIQKRLYMRRKRAEALGKTANTEAVKLRPGRQAKDRKPAKPRPKIYKPRNARSSNRGRKRASQTDVSQNGDEDGDLEVDEEVQSTRSHSYHLEDSEDEDEESAYERRTRGGVTRPYKLKKLFHECGINAQTLSELDMDLFNLTALGRLLSLNNALNAPSRKQDSISISVEFVQLLREMIKEFSSKIIQRAITTKEQEVRLKANLKVWKYGREEISVENMLDCLKAMGLDKLSKERYFSDILVDDDDEFSVEEESIVSDEQSAFESEEDLASESLSSHSMRSESSLLPFPPPPSHLSNLTYCDLLSESEILPSDDDEAALTKELAEEDILDVLDIMRSKEYEKHLWQNHC